MNDRIKKLRVFPEFFISGNTLNLSSTAKNTLQLVNHQKFKMMKTLVKITLVLFVMFGFQSCSKDDPIPQPIAQPEPENQAPTQVSLVSPAADAENIDVRPAFSWEAATDPDGDTLTYEIYADTTAAPSTLIGTTNETSFEPNERLSLLENYNWKVVASDGKGAESESENQSFDTRGINISVATSNSGVAGLTAVFDDKIWVYPITGDYIANSTDGINWDIVNDNPNYTGISVFKIIEYQNKLWMINGDFNGHDEVWNSIDGIQWELVTDTPVTNSH